MWITALEVASGETWPDRLLCVSLSISLCIAALRLTA